MEEEEQRREGEEASRSNDKDTETVLHKTKSVHFFGRTTPIILQNDNGPCPLLAICNVLLLKNQLNLSPDVSEVSQEKLLSLVAERLIDSNSNVTNKDVGYVENQQQNISDAINRLPQLATGIDVNIRFRRIDDFEFTPECAIFDLLDIPLYHGWLVDPQDHETSEAIGSKSYNTLMSDLVSLETWKMEHEGKVKMEEDCIDFAAATTATLGVPSPNLSRAKSFEDSPHPPSEQQALRKGDAEEQAELLRVLELSEKESTGKGDDSGANTTLQGDVIVASDENVHMIKATPESAVSISEVNNCTGSLEPSTLVSADVPGNCNRTSACESHKSIADELREGSLSNNLLTSTANPAVTCEPKPSSSLTNDAVHNQEIGSLAGVAEHDDGLLKQNGAENSSVAGQADSETSSVKIPGIEAVESLTSNLDDSEPIYEGEDCILDKKKTVCEDREPVYEGETVLAERADKGTKDFCDTSQKDEISIRQGELISNFLKNNASQLTFYGLFCLQEGLNERELCVFFRNNHFSTMFKFEGELYLLATDQGYLNQPDLVWEKLNEVNGDTLFMTSNFKEFKLESSGSSTWDEQNAVTSTADYLASIDNSGLGGPNINSDLQLAIALQQQEFEQQPQQNAPQQPSTNGSSRLITGPQAPRSSGRAASSSQRPPEQKPKEKDKSNCKIM